MRTLSAAQKMARKTRAKIVLRGGVYRLDETLRLTAEDSGTSIEAAKGETPVLSGGRKLDLKWRREGEIWAADVKLEEADQLWIGGKRQRMARYPNAVPGKTVFDVWDLVHTGEPDKARDPLDPARVKGWRDPKGGYLHAMHPALWGDMHWRILGRSDSGELKREGGWQNNRPGPMHERYRFVENIREELDAPGEWFYDRESGQLLCIPEEGIDPNRTEVEIVRLRHLIEFNGTRENPVRDVTVKGLTFRQTARTFMDNKEPLLRSDWTVYRGGAVVYNGAANCSLDDCTFDQVGGNTIFVNGWNRKIAIRRCVIRESGANGIAFVGHPKAVRSPLFNYGEAFDYAAIDRTPGPLTEDFPADCLVEDCLITRTGRDEKQTAPVQISMARGITVRHCSIYDVPRAGINISEGTWGGHVIEGCDVFDTVNETGDHGSFNSWGRDRYWHPSIDEVNRQVAADPRLPRLDVVKPNIIRNSRWRCDHGWDIDLDDGSSFYRIENNVLLNGGLKLREGFERVAVNNVIVNNSLHPHCWYAESGDVFERNIVFNAYRPAGGMPAGKWGKSVDRNLFASSESDRLRFANQGCDAHSQVADPGFVDAAAGDFRVVPGSPALKLGFKNFRMDQFGVRPAHLRAMARSPLIPNVVVKLDLSTPPAAVMQAVHWHGVPVRTLGPDEFSAYGVNRDARGVVVDQTPSSGVLKGLERNDLIQSLAGHPVGSLQDLTDVVSRLKGEGPFELGVIRRQEASVITIRGRLLPPRI